MRKVFYWVSTILQMLLFIVAFGIQEFSMKRMGMMRHVVYMNHQWEAQYPIEVLRYNSIAVLAVLSVIVILYALRKKRNYSFSKRTLLMIIAEVIFTLVFAFFTLVYSTESYRSYYFVSLILGVIALIQNLKTIVQLKR